MYNGSREQGIQAIGKQQTRPGPRFGVEIADGQAQREPKMLLLGDRVQRGLQLISTERRGMF